MVKGINPETGQVIDKPGRSPVENKPEPIVIQQTDNKNELKRLKDNPESIIITRQPEPVEPINNKQKIDNMAWKPKTIAGKILKGAVVAGGSVLGLATGIGAISGIAKGVGAVKGASTGIGGLVKTVDKIGQSAVNLVTGTTKEERQIISEVKAEAKDAQHQLDMVDKLVRAGATVEAARAKLGITSTELKEFDGEPVKSSSMFDFLQNKNVLLIGGAILALIVLPKLLKSRR